MTKIKTIIFDYGGVITTTKRSKQFSLWASNKFGVDSAAVMRLFKGEKIDEYQRGKISSEEFWYDFKKLGINLETKELQRQLVSYNTPDTQMEDLIERLKLKYDMCLISDSFPELTIDIINRFSKVFRVMIFSDREGYVKDDKILYDIAFEKINRPPNTCLYIDDREEKLAYPESIGVQCIHFQGYNNLHSRLSELSLV